MEAEEADPQALETVFMGIIVAILAVPALLAQAEHAEEQEIQLVM